MAGFDARVYECDAAGLQAASEQAALVILHRVPWSAGVERLCEAVRQRGGKCIYDTDDLIFNPDHVRWLHFSGPDAKRHAADHRALTTRYFATLDHCDAVFTTTLPLADEIVVLVNGKVLQTGPVLDVFTHPANAEVARFVGVETLQPGKIVSVSEGLATVRIGNALLTALAPAAASREVFVCIRGEDVILQRDDATASSVRNRLAACIVSLRTEGALVRVELDAGFPLFALITRPACAELALREGETITALIKAPAIHLVPR